jgi:arylsulfatase A-like enzyme
MKRLIPLIVIALFLSSACKKEDGPPNIIVILTDDQRLNSLSCYDESIPIQTPHIDRLAGQGIRFDNGFVVSPICAVSRASIITGRYACNNSIHDFNIPIPEDVFEDSYPAQLKKAGYFVGALGKYGVGVTPQVKETFDIFEAQAGQGPRFREYKGKTMHDTEWLTVKTMEFLDAVPENTPFCVQVNYKEPHGSTVPDPRDDEVLEHHMFEKEEMDNPGEYEKLPELVKHSLAHVDYYVDGDGGNLNAYKRNYFEMILSVERSVGEIVNSLEERGLADNTVIIFLSDHGLHLGEKELLGKWTPYDESLRIPFIVYDPRTRSRKGKVRDDMVLNIDVAPTILELAGIEVPEGMDGRSMVSLMDGKEKSWRKEFFYEHYCGVPTVGSYLPRNEGIRTESDKYVRWVDFELTEEYFDMDNDPKEANSLAGNAENEARIEVLRQKFIQWRTENPTNYEHVHNGAPHFATENIDWELFEEVAPQHYGRIKAAIESLGVTWEQAENDWDTRYQVCKKARYWY